MSPVTKTKPEVKPVAEEDLPPVEDLRPEVLVERMKRLESRFEKFRRAISNHLGMKAEHLDP